MGNGLIPASSSMCRWVGSGVKYLLAWNWNLSGDSMSQRDSWRNLGTTETRRRVPL